MKNRKSRRGPVWICSDHGAILDLSAVIYGPLAITRALTGFTPGGFTDGKYAVTHVPTGYRAGVHNVSFKEAKAACEALLDSGIPWANVRPENARRYGKRVKAAFKIIGIDLRA